MAGETYGTGRGCARAREWASLRLDGELSELERLLLRRHLSRCGPCQEFVETVTEVTGALRSAQLEQPSARFEPDAGARRGRPLRYRVAAVAAAVAAGAVAGSLVALSGNESRSPAGTSPITVAILPPDLAPPPTLTQPEENV
jgi:predicted anti-sigma-YlaC factor YlaD